MQQQDQDVNSAARERLAGSPLSINFNGTLIHSSGSLARRLLGLAPVSSGLDLDQPSVRLHHAGHAEALRGRAPIASSVSMIVAHIFCATGRLSR